MSHAMLLLLPIRSPPATQSPPDVNGLFMGMMVTMILVMTKTMAVTMTVLLSVLLRL